MLLSVSHDGAGQETLPLAWGYAGQYVQEDRFLPRPIAFWSKSSHSLAPKGMPAQGRYIGVRGWALRRIDNAATAFYEKPGLWLAHLGWATMAAP